MYLADEVGKILGEGWSAGTYGSKGTGWKFMKGHLMVYYHAADGIHEEAYYWVMKANTQSIKIVDNNYKLLLNDKALIINIDK